MRLGEIRTNRDGLLGVPSRRSPGLLLMLGVQIPDERPGFGALRIGQRIIRIKSNRLIEEANRLPIILHISPCEVKMALQIRVVRFHTFASTRWRRLYLCRAMSARVMQQQPRAISV